ncbi:MAG: glutaminyl-peptide cyclotransferase, partial [Flavobacteriales bacterium]|nr:glutaminyl-peptide cyclotransferase [Flavobacteriales bacterium]
SHYPGSLEMNGIAFDPITNNLFITGKFWPKIYQVTLEEDAAREANSKVD